MPPAVLTPALPTAALRLERALLAAARRWEGRSVLRAEVSVGAVDALAWLRAQPGGDGFYWRGRESASAWAGTGAALRLDLDDLDDLDAVQRVADALPPGARLFLSARFAPDLPPAPEWAAFGRVRAVLPRVELRADSAPRRAGDRAATLAVHLAPGETPDAALAALRALRWPERAAADAFPAVTGRADAPSRAGWHAALGAALAAFDAGDLAKVVLARRARFAFDAPLDPYALLARLEAATPRCFHALVAHPGAAFVSATPERLFRIVGRELRTEAVAGTRPRADLDADDDRLHDELLASDKDQREHAFVRDAIAGRLAPFCEALEIDGQASAMTLARKRHLRTGFRARLRGDARATDILRALHPTPAVGGTPHGAALATIDRLEPFDRGLYAGPLGWIGPGGAEIAVAIRSGLVAGRSLALYSGAGIVPGSDPDAEWAEIEHKIGDFARVLRLGAPAVAA